MRVALWSVLTLLVATLSGCTEGEQQGNLTGPGRSPKDVGTDAAQHVGVGVDAADVADDVADKAGNAVGAVGVDAQALDQVNGRTSMGQAIVGFKQDEWPGLRPGDSLGGLRVLDTIEQLRVAVVAADELRDVRVGVADIPGIAYIEDDNLFSSKLVPSDPGYGDQYGPALVGAEAAWSHAGYGSDDITIAILDSGIHRNHEDLRGSRLLTGYDYVNKDDNPDDDCGHGTHVAGTAAASTGNGRGVAGMSQASILPMKVLSPLVLALIGCSGSASNISKAIIESAEKNADIISMSFGGGGSSTMKNAADYAYRQGSILVASAGNDGSSNGVDCPACYDSVIAVAAVGPSKDRADYSDMGPQVEIAAPGTDVWSTHDASDVAYKKLSGTSMAAPHVAGALALALSCAPSLGASQLRGLLQSSAEDLGASGRDTSFGFGLLRADRLVEGLDCSGASDEGSSSGAIGSTNCGTDPAASVPLLPVGSWSSATLSEDEWAHFKLCVDAGKSLFVETSGPPCSLLSCELDGDLYVRAGAIPTRGSYDCRPYLTGNSESCTMEADSHTWYFVSIHAAAGSGTVDLAPSIT